MVRAMSALNLLDVAAMKKSTQLLPCLAGLQLHITMLMMAVGCPSRAAYSIGEVPPGWCVFTNSRCPSVTALHVHICISHTSIMPYIPRAMTECQRAGARSCSVAKHAKMP